MKDEEMAEEYRKSLKQRLIDEDDFERLEMFDENVEESFLAGLKAGRPQWHTDPNDLPKEKGDVLVLIDWGLEKPSYGLAYWNGQTFKMYTDTKVIAWCEIPTFDKE